MNKSFYSTLAYNNENEQSLKTQPRETSHNAEQRRPS